MQRNNSNFSDLSGKERYNFLANLADNIAKIFIALFKYGGYSIIAFYTYKCISEIAGYTTIADIKAAFSWHINGGSGSNAPQPFLFFSKYNLSVLILSATVFCTGIWYGKKQLRLRRDTIERLQERIVRYEKQLDKNRTSSNLGPRGITNLGDEK